MKKLIAVAVATVAALVATPGAASARKSYIICHDPGGTQPTWAFRVKPARCTSLGPTDPFGLAVNLVGLRSKGWGRASAMSTGYEQGFHLPPSHIWVHGAVYRQRVWRGRRIYTRLRASSRFGTSIVVLDAR